MVMQQQKLNQSNIKPVGAIPGQGMTAEKNSRPWLNPPKLSTVEETLEFYFDRMLQEEATMSLLSIIKRKMPISLLAESMTTGGVMQGMHTIDVAILVNPILMEFMKGMAEKANIEYVLDSTVPKKERANFTALREVMNQKLEDSEEEIENVGDQVQSQGLMSRPEENME